MKKRMMVTLLSAAMVAGAVVPTVTCMAAEKAEDMTFVVIPKCVHAWFDEVNKGAQKQADLLSAQLGVEVKVDYRAP